MGNSKMTPESICLPAESAGRKKVVSNAELARKLDALEQTIDGQFEIVFEAMAELLEARVAKRKPIGFRGNFSKQTEAEEPKENAA